MTPDLILAVLGSSCGPGRFGVGCNVEVALWVDESARLVEVDCDRLGEFEKCGALSVVGEVPFANWS